jgi:hypothetical protein
MLSIIAAGFAVFELMKFLAGKLSQKLKNAF